MRSFLILFPIFTALYGATPPVLEQDIQIENSNPPHTQASNMQSIMLHLNNLVSISKQAEQRTLSSHDRSLINKNYEQEVSVISALFSVFSTINNTENLIASLFAIDLHTVVNAEDALPVIENVIKQVKELP